ncbi:MAG: glycosyltransferase, partial [Acidobacteria bacterium]|nr:glycosyltransferase [Acidobacteriota bacterium]
VSISDAQRQPLPRAAWVGTVRHGLPAGLLPFSPEPGGYLAFLGRVSPEKGVGRAIAIARACGIPLRIAAKVDPADRVYFETEIRPLLDDPLVEFIGEIGENEKGPFLGGARALLFPIDWPEPFGVVMIEALACGLPVVAFEGGSVGEVISNGVNGFVVRSVEEAVHAVHRIGSIDRRACRADFERRFTASRMAADYLALYRAVRRAAAAFRLPRPALSPAVEAPVAAGEAPVPAGEYGGPANGRSGFTGGARRANDLGESGHL